MRVASTFPPFLLVGPQLTLSHMTHALRMFAGLVAVGLAFLVVPVSAAHGGDCEDKCGGARKTCEGNCSDSKLTCVVSCGVPIGPGYQACTQKCNDDQQLCSARCGLEQKGCEVQCKLPH